MTDLYIPDRSLPRAFICDIDGTLTDHEGIRGHFEYAKVKHDRPIYHIIHIVEALYRAKEWVPIFVSGREEFSRLDTEDWIDAYVAVGYHKLFMRPDGDYRKDFIIKEEIFWNHIAPKYWVEFSIDDRSQVVSMWRSIGVPCLQVAEGDF